MASALFLAVHIVVAALLAAGSVLPVSNSMFMVMHRLSGGQVTQSWVDFDDMSPFIKQAAIASEDGRFMQHRGFDFDSIRAAIKSNQNQGRVVLGGSTISQQLAKNLFLTPHRSYLRKAEEAVVTLMMEQFWSKQRILEVYLNVVEFGEGVYGVEAASWHYFNKPAAKLSREQAALLITLLPNPKYYGKHLGLRRLKNKQNIILKRMKQVSVP